MGLEQHPGSARSIVVSLEQVSEISCPNNNYNSTKNRRTVSSDVIFSYVKVDVIYVIVIIISEIVVITVIVIVIIEIILAELHCYFSIINMGRGGETPIFSRDLTESFNGRLNRNPKWQGNNIFLFLREWITAQRSHLYEVMMQDLISWSTQG